MDSVKFWAAPPSSYYFYLVYTSLFFPEISTNQTACLFVISSGYNQWLHL